MPKPKIDIAWPPKLPKGFPLTVNGRGYVKRINGKPVWICGKRSPEEALKVYHRKAGALVSGAVPMPEPKRVEGIVTVHYILGRWLQERRADAERGELKPGTFMQYRLSGKRIDAEMGGTPVDDLTPDHVKALHQSLTGKYGVDFARRAVEHLRSCCMHAFDSGWCHMPRLGRRVVAKLSSRPRAEMKWKLWTPEQVRKILATIDGKIAAGNGRSRPSWEQMKAMTLLALNGGYGAKELSDLPRSAVDLADARIDYRRAKTGVNHVVPLWPETVEALRPVLDQRPGDDLLFRTREGNPWCRIEPVHEGGKLKKISSADHVNERFSELLKPMGLKTRGVGFYKLRHLFATTADTSLDRNAVSVLMGHALPGSRSHYIAVGEERLRAVVDLVRAHLIIEPSISA